MIAFLTVLNASADDVPDAHIRMQGDLRTRIRSGDIDSPPDPARTARPATVVALGNSTTARRSGIKQVCEQRLAAALPGMRIINAGVGGDTTEGARARFEEDVLGHRPDIVVIQLGANDAAIDVWRGQTTPRVPAERYEENLRYFVRELRERRAHVVLMTAGMFRWTPGYSWSSRPRPIWPTNWD